MDLKNYVCTKLYRQHYTGAENQQQYHIPRNTETKEIGLDYGIQAIEKTEDELRAKIIMKISVFIPCVEETKNEYTMVIEGLFSVPVSVPEEEFIKLLT